MATTKRVLMAGALALILAPLASTQALDDDASKSGTSAAGSNNGMTIADGGTASYVARRSDQHDMNHGQQIDDVEDLKLGRSWYPRSADPDLEPEGSWVFKEVGDSGSSEVGFVDTTGSYTRLAIVDILPSANRIDVVVRLDAQQDSDPMVATFSMEAPAGLPAPGTDPARLLAARLALLLGSILAL